MNLYLENIPFRFVYKILKIVKKSFFKNRASFIFEVHINSRIKDGKKHVFGFNLSIENLTTEDYERAISYYKKANEKRNRQIRRYE